MDGRSEFIAVPGFPDVRQGDDLGELVAKALEHAECVLEDGDIIVVAQKVVSKAEGRFLHLRDIEPSPRALELASEIGSDPRKVQAVFDESTEIVRTARTRFGGLIIARHKNGWVSANAGIDESNVGREDGTILLLPEDADASAKRIGTALERSFGKQVGVLVTDTFGRPWRQGLVNITIGSYGVPPIIEWVGKPDAYGRSLNVTLQAFADEVAAAAGIFMKKDAGLPLILAKGLDWQWQDNASAQTYVRKLSEDLFR
ncbi:coenzyme F420-0:L-glutamate ligase [Agrobacterium rubi]|uniref:Coenzyme F420-0:L-glutamate ligase n=2 Tax=Rhizobium/Agrobacterium group TaxID=227290 RepID=A0AAE7R8Z9_9HYPH|nr:coenzyme F420-0:L-glutamate ligase [Agrobacterium rubi]NTF05293.1 coenzyme F420-0:L-glutamate ligase [Agrobacterium rubi]NTF10533.1 coenzyme F420-0:L-glutamate ligase [Agrobacterium rubi]NTF22927.1 coenzyme F420-0:L-glutamate ligase [Agrobacterium rubi]NTF29858.1 coenzyme F420-0:L-glutamate ligase [Agrobacterium rubi]